MHNKYDFVIIGAGLGGLATSLILSKEGYKTLLIEKNNLIGGTLQSFKRKNCHFDTGMHYLGSLDKGQVLYKIFKYFEILDQIPVKKMDTNGFDIFNIAGKEYYYGMGYDNFKAQLLKSFPEEEKAIDLYISKIRTVSDSFDLYNMRYPVKMDLDSLDAVSENLQEFLDSITDNNMLKQVLSGLNSLYAGTPENTSLYIHALINNYYIKSAYRVLGGGNKIAQAFAHQIKKYGGEILVNQELVSFDYDDEGKIICANTSKKQKFYADNFISDLHPELTIKIAGEERFRKVYVKRIKSLENSISTFVVHLVLKNNNFPELNANYHYYEEPNVWGVSYYNKDTWPQGYMLYTSCNTETENKCLSIFTYMKFDEVEQWADTKVGKRPQAYYDWKEAKSKELIKFVSKQFPGLENNVESFYSSSPLTYRDYTGSKDGSMYGILRDSRNPVKSQIMPRTKIPNLFLTGQNLNLHGMLGVIMSSFVTAGEFTGLNHLVKQVDDIE